MDYNENVWRKRKLSLLRNQNEESDIKRLCRTIMEIIKDDKEPTDLGVGGNSESGHESGNSPVMIPRFTFKVKKP